MWDTAQRALRRAQPLHSVRVDTHMHISCAKGGARRAVASVWSCGSSSAHTGGHAASEPPPSPPLSRLARSGRAPARAPPRQRPNDAHEAARGERRSRGGLGRLQPSRESAATALTLGGRTTQPSSSRCTAAVCARARWPLRICIRCVRMRALAAPVPRALRTHTRRAHGAAAFIAQHCSCVRAARDGCTYSAAAAPRARARWLRPSRERCALTLDGRTALLRRILPVLPLAAAGLGLNPSRDCCALIRAVVARVSIRQLLRARRILRLPPPTGTDAGHRERSRF